MDKSIAELAKELSGKKTMGDLMSILDEKKVFSVRPHIGRIIIKCNLGLNLLDLSSFDDSEKNKINENVEGLSVKAVPKRLEAKLRSIDNATRQELQKRSIGKSTFITKNNLEAFMKFWDEKKAQYFEIRDEIVDNYKEIMDNFLEDQKKMISVLAPDKVSYLMAEIKATIPSVETFRNSFYMELEFDTNVDLAVFSVATKKSIDSAIKENYQNKVFSIIGSALNEVFEAVNKFYLACSKKYSDGRDLQTITVDALSNKAKAIKENNVFGNVFIDKACQEMLNISKNSSNLALCIGTCEDLLSNIYQFSVTNKMETAIELKNCPISRTMLLDNDD